MDGDSTNDVQRVMTYTVGLDIDNNLLKKTAIRGGSGESGYYTANNSADLAASFSALFAEINAASATYTTPSVGGSVANDARSLNYIYYSFFTPTDTSRWDGNLKKYRLANDNNGDLQVVDVNGVEVFNNQGQIKSVAKGDGVDVQSLWSSSADADVINSGGVGESLVSTGHAARIIKINLDADSNPATQDVLQNFVSTNGTITNTIMHTATTGEKTDLINWARGEDPADSSATRWIMGDPLHSSPTVINYGKRENNSAYAGDYSDIRLLVGSNSGFMHMFRDDLGGPSNTCSSTIVSNICFGHTTNDAVTESWAFIPRELTHILDDLKNNSSSVAHPYGVDGTAGVYIYDKNQDGNICTGNNDCNSNNDFGADDDDRVIAVFGLRRGVDTGGAGYY